VNENPDLRPVDYIRCGKPRKYPLEVDVELINFIFNPETPLLQKGMKGLIKHYVKLLDERSPFDPLILFRDKDELPPNISEKSLRVHISTLVKEVGLVFKRPKTVDLDRVHIFDSLNSWFHNNEIISLISSVDRRLLFNADETSVCWIIDSAEKVVCEPDEQPIVPSQVRDGKHITVFPIVSAAGIAMTPYVILHCEREEFVDESSYPIVAYRTEHGYMDQKTFAKVMNDVFIKKVEQIRLNVEGNKRAVLLVDGHISRYGLDCLELLKTKNIDLVAFPAHTSHVVQPLDLGLNRIIKAYFREEWPKAHPSFPVDTPKVGRPPKRRRKASDDELIDLEQMATALAPCGSNMVSQFRLETPEETQARVKRAVYRRAKVVKALVAALQRALINRNIDAAWAQSHLYPLQEDPPYTLEEEQKLIREALSAHLALPKETQRKKNHIIGILTSESAMNMIRSTPQLVQSVTRIHTVGRRPSVTNPVAPVQENPATQPANQMPLTRHAGSTPSDSDTSAGPSKTVKQKRTSCSKRK